MPIFNGIFFEVDQKDPKQQRLGPLGLSMKGPIIPIELSIPDKLAAYYASNNLPIPSPISGTALVDTGASITAVDLSTLQKLGIRPVGTATVYTPQGSDIQELYPVKLTLQGPPIVITLNAVLGSQLVQQNIIALIGRNVLNRCILVYNGPIGSFSLSI